MESTGNATGDHEGSSGRADRRFARERILDPLNLTLLPNLVLLALGRNAGIVANVPLWQLLGSLTVAHLVAVAVATACPPGTPRARPRLFLIVTIGLSGLFIYITGWGAAFVAAFLAVAIVVIQADGSRYGRTAIVAIVATAAAGETGVALGIFHRMMPAHTTHVMAAVETGLAALVAWLVARGQREKEHAEARQRESEERFRALVQHASDAIVVVEDGGRVLYASPAVERILGVPPETLVSFDPSWIDPDHVDAVVDLFRELRTRPGADAAIDVPARRADGSSRWVEVHITNLIESSAVRGFVCNMHDIGERHVAQQKLIHDAQHDELTGLPNRRQFMECLRDGSVTVGRGDHTAVLFVDVDNFKTINDKCGHDTGDAALVAVAESLTAMVRPGDVVARFGGDEFTVLLRNLEHIEAAAEVAERITGGLTGRRVLNGHVIWMSVSVGIATAAPGDSTGSELLTHADHAMYEAKRAGRARWTRYDPVTPAERTA